MPEGSESLLWTGMSDASFEVFRSQVQTFNDQSAHTINPEIIADMEERAESAIPAGQGPELIDLQHSDLGRYVDNGWISDQEGNLEVTLEDEYVDTAIEPLTFDGVLGGLPTSGESCALIYNKDMIDSPPETLEEMTAIMEEHHDPDNGTYGLSYYTDPYFCSWMAEGMGTRYWSDEEGQPQITSDDVISGMQLLVDELIPYTPADHTYDPQAAVFSQGNAPMTVNGPWSVSGFQDAGIDVGVAPFPDFPGGSPNPAAGIDMWMFCTAMDDDQGRAEAGRSFVEWYSTNEDILIENAQERGRPPVHQDVVGHEDLPDIINGFAQALEQGTMQHRHPDVATLWEPMADGIMRIVEQGEPVEDVFNDVEQTVMDELES
jgi:arabinogalactan oligomer/maltooligosaccharide transport system substrate-binding protein